MIYVVIFGVALVAFFVGIGVEAFVDAHHTDEILDQLYRKEIECERLKEGRP